jgi:hypothetical protein
MEIRLAGPRSGESSAVEPCPEPTAIDYFAGIVKLGISAIPDWGGPASELFGLLTAPLLGKRRDEWFEELRTRLNELSLKVEGLTIQSLAQNEQFVSATLQATQAALRTNQQEKREALRNAVLNVAAGNAPEQDMQSILLDLVDDFTPIHLQVLHFFQAPEANVREQLARQRDLTDQVVLDLNRRGLVKDPRMYVAQNRESLTALVTYAWELTAMGKKLLQFISASF